MSSNVRGLWEFAEDEPLPKGIRVDPVFVAYEFDTEKQAKLAWEKGNDVAQHVSIWRMMKPDGSKHQIVCLGEDAKKVRRVEAVLVRHGGTFWVPERGMIRALAMRRYGTAIEEARKAARGEPHDSKILNRWGEQGGMRLAADGTMEPYKKGDE